MDLKTRLENELIFAKIPHANLVISGFNEKGIFTVEDFINYDIEQIKSYSTRKRYSAFQKILKYKYLGEPFTMDIILEREYNDEAQIFCNLYRDTTKLGFGDYHFELLAKEILNKKGSCKMIDIISIMSEKFDFLKKFYIEYYDSQMKKENIEKVSIDSDKKSLNTLKNELVSLLNQRNILDTKIALLLEQINTLEGGKTNNARK